MIVLQLGGVLAPQPGHNPIELPTVDAGPISPILHMLLTYFLPLHASAVNKGIANDADMDAQNGEKKRLALGASPAAVGWTTSASGRASAALA
eukprot:gene20482-27270_t